MSYQHVVAKKRELLAEHPEKADVSVQVSSRQLSGLKSVVKARNFELTVDMPGSFESGDEGPRPGELVLAALAACHEITYRLYADYLGIPLEEVAVNVTGVSDARGFLAQPQDPPIRAGYKHITGEINLKSTASDADLERLRQAVNAHCPVLDDLKHPVPVELAIKRIR